MAARNEFAPLTDIFVLPILNQRLIYAPLHDLAALVDGAAARRIRSGLLGSRSAAAGQVGEIVRALQAGGEPAPRPRQGDLKPPFLGLIPTRRCNLACEYCGFLADDDSEQVMDLHLARQAVAWYLDRVGRSGARTAEVHFFGGEPFCAEEVVDFVYHFARLKAARVGCEVRFEAATNGAFSEERCRWVAGSLDSVILSLDGPAPIQDRYRHRRDGRGSFRTVARNARLLSDGETQLSLRVCVTAETVDSLPQIAAWLCQEFRPASVCFEPVQPTPETEAAGLVPPDPWAFAAHFVRAAWALEAHGIQPIYAAADIRVRQVSFCPVGQDVVIVSPDGALSACYLLQQDWEARGLDLRLGSVENGAVRLDAEAVEAVRGLNVWNKPACAACFCKWHCAGGCHVNHPLPDAPGGYDRLCLQTRLITVRNILKAMGRDDLTADLLGSPEALERAARQASDRLADVEMRP